MEQSDADALASGIFFFKSWVRERIGAGQVPAIAVGRDDGHSASANDTCHFFVIAAAVPPYSTELSASSLRALGRGRLEETGPLKRDLDRIVSALRAQ